MAETPSDMSPVLELARALNFAARKHIDQRRKGSRAEPYLNHLTEVAWLLAEATNGDDAHLVVAGLLHDVIEDTDTSPEELTAEFGDDVAQLVLEVTDDRRLPKAERKRLQVATATSKSERARMIKLADKISNLRSMSITPPQGWSLERRREYVLWAGAVGDHCRGINPRLDQWFVEAFSDGMAEGDEAPGLSAGAGDD